MPRLRILPLCLLLAAIVPAAQAQTVTAVPKLDPNRFFVAWHQIERYIPRAEKDCLSDAVMLYAPGDKTNTLKVVAACAIKDDSWDFWDVKGKLDPAGSGRLSLTHWLIFHSPYWVLATGPNYDWALVGTPNRKSLWILAQPATLPSGTLAQIEALAAAQGFNTAKLQKVKQTDLSPFPLPSAPAPSTSPAATP